jgi:hypothetical protein
MGTGALFSYEKKLPYAVATVTPLAEGHAEAGVPTVDWHGLGLKSASDNLPFTSIGTCTSLHLKGARQLRWSYNQAEADGPEDK